MSTKTKKPLVSICVPCYNHEKYISMFIESVLSQDYENWELIITDDCSTDNSYQLLKSYKDKRIKIYKNDKNRHLCDTLNNSFKHASGDYVCIMYTDDAMCKNKLKHDVDFMEKHKDIGVLYNNSIWVDDYNNILETKYSAPNISQNEFLRLMYLKSNQISIPGMFIRANILKKVGYHNRLLRLTQDYESHVRFLFNTKCAISDVPTVMYRIRNDEQNLSKPSDETTNAQRIEIPFVLKQYVKNISSVKQLLEIFPQATKYGTPKKYSIPYFLGRIALESDINSVKYFGIQLLYEFMSDDKNIAMLEKEYNFLPKDFMNLIKNNIIFVQPQSEYKKKYKKYKKLFNIVTVLLCIFVFITLVLI